MTLIYLIYFHLHNIFFGFSTLSHQECVVLENILAHTTSTVASGSSGLSSSPGQGHCVVFLGKTLYSRSASLHPGVQMGSSKFNAGGNPAMD